MKKKLYCNAIASMVQLIIFFSFAEHSVRLSEYVYKPVKNNTDLCDPDGFQWKRNVTVSMVITGEQHLMFLQHVIPVKNDVFCSCTPCVPTYCNEFLMPMFVFRLRHLC